MKYIILNDNKLNGFSNGIQYMITIPILSGEYKGKFACSYICKDIFADVFKEINYEIVELDNSAFQIDYTLPPASPYGLEILEKWYDLFPDNKFVLGSYEIPLEEKNGVKYVNTAYFEWQDFRDALDELLPNGEFRHAGLKRALMSMWDYLIEQGNNNNVIVL